ncbi:MAG TPA: hypothetical protein PLU35_07130 [Phycisphaerales bacterium]|nr:hypothetical protein [Phycisphaerales bacterium]
MAHEVEAGFETTRWSLVVRLRCGEDERRAALEELARVYRPAVYGYLRRRGLPPDEADEATQDFFVSVVFSRGLVERADQDKGRLRTLILTALQRHETDRHRRRMARGGPHRSLDASRHEEAMLASELPDDPVQAFERRWATAQVEEAMRRCEAHFRAIDKPGHWALFESRYVRPAISPCRAPPTAEVSDRFGFRSPADANAAVQTVKKRYLAILREVVAETTCDEAQADNEYESLLSMLAC